jgi:hypothetical protein
LEFLEIFLATDAPFRVRDRLQSGGFDHLAAIAAPVKCPLNGPPSVDLFLSDLIHQFDLLLGEVGFIRHSSEPHQKQPKAQEM